MAKSEFDLTQLGTMSEKKLAALEAKLSAKVEKMDADMEKIATEKSELQKTLAATQKVIDFSVGKELVKEARKANIAIRKSDIPRIIGFLQQEQKEVSLSEPIAEKNDKQPSEPVKEEIVKTDDKKKLPENKTGEKNSSEENEDSPVLKKILARNEAEKKQVEESKTKQSPTPRMTISDKFR